MQPPGDESDHRSDREQPARARRLSRRERVRTVVVLVVCFLVGVPLVSVRDGAILSGVGLLLVAVAGIGLIWLVVSLAGEGEDRDPEDRPEE